MPKASRGWDNAKKGNGRKRYIAVDTGGLPLEVLVTPASVQDRDAARPLLWNLKRTPRRVRRAWAAGPRPRRRGFRAITNGKPASASSLRNASTRLIGSLPELDSMAVAELLAAIEERFGFEADDADITIDILETVGTLAAFVEKNGL